VSSPFKGNRGKRLRKEKSHTAKNSRGTYEVWERDRVLLSEV
jgi:hypothetical protein